MNIPQNDREVLRKLAAEYMEYALLPVQREKMELWKALNRGEMRRPMVVIDQLPWNELNNHGELTCLCKNAFCRGLEHDLRQTLYKWKHFPVDMVLEPYITARKCVYNSGYGIAVDEETLALDKTSGVVSHSYVNQIQTEDDIEKIKDVVVTCDEEGTGLWFETVRDILDGVAPVRLGGGVQFHLGIWDNLSTYMGVENIFYDLCDRPEFIHKVLERMTASAIAGIEQANKLGAVCNTALTCHCSYIFTDELLPDFGASKGPVSQNSWAFGLAQLFTSVSPAFTEEFEIPYISRMAECFGMLYYGCCDRLDDRLDLVKKIPHVKKVSCSPWSDRERFAENIGPELIMSNKPTPAFVAGDSFDGDVIQKDLERTVEAARRNNVNLEFILKDISTVRYQPERLTQWAEIAMKVAEG